MPLFGNKTKSPAELVASCDEGINQLKNAKDKDRKKASDELSKNLQAIKVMMYGTTDQTPLTEQVNSMAQDIYNQDLLLNLVAFLHLIDFEGRKDVGTIFNNMLRRQIGARSPTVEYVMNKHEIIKYLVFGYENQEIALNCGIMLREICRHSCLNALIFDKGFVYNFFDYVEVSTFDIASDAFSTFKDVLTKHKTASAAFLEKDYDKFFTHYQRLLNSENYVTRRQALKLLGELLLDRHNFTVMNKYISNADNLKLMMNMLREKSRNIQFEAFHVFKIFVANPNKTKQVLDILLRNKEKLVDFLSKFHTDRTEDEQFNDEKSYLMKQITELKPMEEDVPAS